MRSRLLIALTAAALLAPVGAARADDCPGATLLPDATNVAQVSQATLCLVNQQRAAAGVAPVTTNAQLTTMSNAYALDMVARRYFDHTTPDGTTLVQRLAKAGYDWKTAGENLAWGSESLATPAATVDAWMHSDEHRRNMLDPDFTQIGVGVALGAPVTVPGQAATYVTDFGTPPAGEPRVVRTASSSSVEARAAAKPHKRAGHTKRATHTKRARHAKRHHRALHRHHAKRRHGKARHHHHRHHRTHRHHAAR